MERTILHCDCNGFYASVECVLHPELRTVPMAVCGDPESRRGIILAKNELAKGYGIKTAETIWQAKRKCPQLVLAPAHHDQYALFSKRINGIYQRYTDLVEPFSIDESWLDVTGSRELFGGGKKIADELRKAVREETGVTISVGVSFNKVFAKLGSDYKKPDAVTVFGREQMESVIWKLPAQALLFVGPHTEKTLEKFGIHTIGDIARMELPAMRRMLGKTGEALWTYANGLDHSPVAAAGAGEPPKTIGNSTTLPRDVTTEEEIKCTLLSLAESVSFRLRRQDLKAGEIQLTVKNAEFEEFQRQCRIDPPVCDSQSIYRAALNLYRRENKKWAVRLLGVRAGKLTDAGQAQQSLFGQSDGREKQERLESAMDRVREKYGKASVARAFSMPGKERE